jgi:hypothetical protein
VAGFPNRASSVSTDAFGNLKVAFRDGRIAKRSQIKPSTSLFYLAIRNFVFSPLLPFFGIYLESRLDLQCPVMRLIARHERLHR